MDLKQFRATVLRLDKPEEVLRLADKYLVDMANKGDSFILPRDHMVVKPILEFYAGDLVGWVKFVKGIRERLPIEGRRYHEGVNTLYRTLVIRQTQMERRERLDDAVEVAVKKKLIPNEPEAKSKYAKRCTQVWKVRKDNLLKVHASQTKRGVLSVEEREGILQEFWSDIAAEIANGEVPKP